MATVQIEPERTSTSATSGTECCDICAEHGITTIAVADVPVARGQWANVCAAHLYRLQSAGRARGQGPGQGGQGCNVLGLGVALDEVCS